MRKEYDFKNGIRNKYKLRCALCLKRLGKNPLHVTVNDPKWKVVGCFFVHRSCGKKFLDNYIDEKEKLK